MKKFIFLTLLALAGTSVMAQQKPLELGIHGGWSYTKMYADNHRTRTHWGYSAGIFGRVNLVKQLYLEPGLNYVHKEVILERSVNDTKLRASSVEVPVLLGVKFLNFPLIKVRGFVGPVASILTKPIKYDDYVADMNNPPEVTSSKSMFYARAGLGVDVWQATFDLSYEVGMKKFAPTLSVPQTFNITLGIKIF
ncbi:MAG: PorT family protein [Odoribacteraceae bacterium]|jgi:hypothetical protein|nr:PorT family protein [Odoribacteraceae bacterium]